MIPAPHTLAKLSHHGKNASSYSSKLFFTPKLPYYVDLQKFCWESFEKMKKSPFWKAKTSLKHFLILCKSQYCFHFLREDLWLKIRIHMSHAGKS